MYLCRVHNFLLLLARHSRALNYKTLRILYKVTFATKFVDVLLFRYCPLYILLQKDIVHYMKSIDSIVRCLKPLQGCIVMTVSSTT